MAGQPHERLGRRNVRHSHDTVSVLARIECHRPDEVIVFPAPFRIYPLQDDV